MLCFGNSAEEYYRRGFRQKTCTLAVNDRTVSFLLLHTNKTNKRRAVKLIHYNHCTAAMLADPHFKPDELSPALSFSLLIILTVKKKKKTDLPMWLHPKKELTVRGVHLHDKHVERILHGYAAYRYMFKPQS